MELDKNMQDMIHKQLSAMEAHVEITATLIDTTPSLKQYLQLLIAYAEQEKDFQEEDITKLFTFAFTCGFAKAMYDINSGYINITTIEKEISNVNTNDQSENPRTTEQC